MFDEDRFQHALAQPRLRGHVPTHLKSNRAEPIRVLQEPELQAMTKQWFVDFEEKLAHYSKHFGTDLAGGRQRHQRDHRDRPHRQQS